MKKLNDFFEKHFIPFAVKLNNIKGLIAIRDAFIQIFPLTFVGSIAVCINCVVFNSTGFIGQLLISVIPELDKYQDILSPIQNGTINIMAIFIVFLIAKNMARQHHEDETKTELLIFTKTALRIYTACLFLFGIQMACQMTFTSLGKAGSSIIVAVMRKFVLLIPLIYIMPVILSNKKDIAVYMAEPIADFFAVSFTAVLFFFQFRKCMRQIEQKTF